MKESHIYLDCAAAMPPDDRVLEYYGAMLKEFYVNQEAIHLLAYRGRQALADAERRLAAVLTGNGGNHVIWGGSATDLFRWLAGVPFFRSAVTSVLEHPALTANLRKLPQVALWRADGSGRIVPQKFDAVPDAVFFHHVQSELGVIQDLAGVFDPFANSCRVVDAVQAAGKLDMYPEADVWIISGAKFGAPGGAAAILNAGSRFAGKLLEHSRKFRHDDYAAGRMPVALSLAVTMAAECSCARRRDEELRLKKLHRMVIDRCAEWQIVPTVPAAAVSPYILNLTLPSQQSAIVVRALSERGIYTASGSACSAESDTPSAAMLAIGRSKSEAYRALRVSFGAMTTEEDVKIFLFELENVLKNY